MAINNHERVGRALDLLKQGLSPFVLREMQNAYGDKALAQAALLCGDDNAAKRPMDLWDAPALLKVMIGAWHGIFRNILGQAERALVSELIEHRNRWAHQQSFSGDDADRALDSAARLLTSVAATAEADEVNRMKLELRRQIFDSQMRTERRKGAALPIEGTATATMKAWRDVVTPHKDVTTGRFQQAEFAADLWQVFVGEGEKEYLDPSEFFRRTYLTESLRRLLVAAVERMNGVGGDPVVQLQTNFGGGKTHSMLALFHLVSGVKAQELPGIDDVLQEAGAKALPKANRVVLVGNKLSPGNPTKKSDGTLVRTLWGELAWQLGFAAGGEKEARKAFERIRADDEHATSPGDVLRELLKQYGPSLILIDEWVAYARTLHEQPDLPGGSFETQFTFAQALSESAKGVKNCMLVVSLPFSDRATSPHATGDDVEVGGQRGREALDRLRNVIGRVESSWRPATAEEGFEIVRRRLFEPMLDPDVLKARDVVCREFADWYRKHKSEFPLECADADYEKRMRAAYPIHPEVFDRLYTEWSTLLKFQRTRGVLRLMAAVIHSLWVKDDKNPVILPALIPIDDDRVRPELLRYLPDNWIPVIEKEVDGSQSLPTRIDGENSGTFGRLSACRRVARTIYIGSAPMTGAANLGIEDRRIKVGCTMPGESPNVFGDALRHLAAKATYLHGDSGRYWFSTRANVTQLADDRAEQLRREPDRVARELAKRLARDLTERGDFVGVHALPSSSADVPDEFGMRLVVLDAEHAHAAKESSSAAAAAVREILERRGSMPREFKNALIFLAPDRTRLTDLDEALRRYLAWESIIEEKDALELTSQVLRNATQQKAEADKTVAMRVPETFAWMFVPTQPAGVAGTIELEAIMLKGLDPLAVRASKRLEKDALVAKSYVGSMLRRDLDRAGLWRGRDHVAVSQVVADYASYPYLQRMRDPTALLSAIRDGVGVLTWRKDAFAFADVWDEVESRYRGLRAGVRIDVTDAKSPALLVKPDVAARQLDSETSTPDPRGEATGGGISGTGSERHVGTEPNPEAARVPTRFHASVRVDANRLGREAGKIADEVLSHLSGLVGSHVHVTLEIEADVKKGVPEHVVRTVTENCKTLKFESYGFEER